MWSVPFIYRGDNSWDQMQLISVTQKEITTPPQSVGYVFSKAQHIVSLIAARMHCGFILNLLSTKTPKSFYAKLFSTQSALSLYFSMGLFHSNDGNLYLPLLNFMKFLPAVPPSLLRSLWVENCGYAQPITDQKLLLLAFAFYYFDYLDDTKQKSFPDMELFNS